jgi:GTPase
MLERPQSGELALLVHIYFKKYEPEEVVKEFQELALAAGAQPVTLITGRQRKAQVKYFIGLGKLEEIYTASIAHRAQLILFNHDLSPAQERNLEQKLHCRVLGRTGLILDIFAQRARTFEGKLQVKLAQLEHLSTRLIRGWTHLERQRGGIGLRGPGETQLETDKRLIRQQIKIIKNRLEKVRTQRAQSQRARKKSRTPYIALVGYTNTGKSTLFNRLTKAMVFVANQPFATLDPSIRRVCLNDGQIAILADTVGFIRRLPHHLVVAFRATLEETQQAELLLHVVDATNTEKPNVITLLIAF